jgi:hypothetical protein
MSYFEKYCIKYGQDSIGAASIPPAPDKADFHHIDIEGLEVEQIHTFGGEHLCKQILNKFELKECLNALGFNSKETNQALISIAARAVLSGIPGYTKVIRPIQLHWKTCWLTYRSMLLPAASRQWCWMQALPVSKTLH